MEFLFPMVVMTTGWLVIGWIVRSVATSRTVRETARLRSELHGKLLERFGSGAELRQYLESDAGRRFLDSATLERGSPYARIIASVQAGILVICGSLGLFAVSGFVRADAANAVQVFATLALVLGVGFLVSSGVSYYLSRRWKLLGAVEPPSE